MSMKKLKIHVVHELSESGAAYGCSDIRLIKPLSHPSIKDEVSLSFGLEIPDQSFDVIIVERLANFLSDSTINSQLLKRAHENNTKIIYEIDDDLLSLNLDVGTRCSITTAQKMWVRKMVRESDGVIVSTSNLAARFERLNRNIEIVPNALDENLFLSSEKYKPRKGEGSVVVFGYMGTYTHLEDLLSILHPLRTVIAKYKDSIRFEIVGVDDGNTLNSLFPELPVRTLVVSGKDTPYPDFVRWFQKNIKWDFGIAPLINSEFNSSKSDIKYLDYGAHSIPGIFSHAPAYSHTIRHQENGILADSLSSWAFWLEKLILDHSLRSQLARQAHSDVWGERMLRVRAYEWIDALKKLISKSSKLITNQNRVSYDCTLNLSRNEKLLFGCDMHGKGLEIGASYSPVAPKRAGYHVEVIDHCDASTLKKKYQDLGVDISNIEEVDYIWTGEPLNELTGKTDHYDWIIASHVIEHTPDMVSFLRQCEIMLKPGGILCLAVPDHRYCFDVFRPVSSPGEVIQAYLEKRIMHSYAAIWDHFSMISKKGESLSWSKGHYGDFYFIHPNLDVACEMLLKAQESHDYIDVHNWRFTPSSFKLILNDIGVLGYTKLAIKNFFNTEGCEFIVQLQKESSGRIHLTDNERKSLVHSMLDESL